MGYRDHHHVMHPPKEAVRPSQQAVHQAQHAVHMPQLAKANGKAKVNVNKYANEPQHAIHRPQNVNHYANVQTIVSVVYVTATPTFDGPVGGYITLSPSAASTSTVEPSSTTKENHHTNTVNIPIHTHKLKSSATGATSDDFAQSSVLATSDFAQSFSSSNVAVPTTLATQISPPAFPSYTLSTTSAAVASTSVAIISPTAVLSTSATASPSNSALLSSAADASSVQHQNGLTPGGKAGIAIGVLLGIGLLIGAIYFLFRRRQNRDYDEKADNNFGERRVSKHNQSPAQPSFSIRRSILQTGRLSMGPLSHVFNTIGDRGEGRPRSNGSSDPFSDHAAPIVDEKKHPMLPTLGPLADAAVPKPLSIRSDRTGHGQSSPFDSPSPSPASRNAQSPPKPSNVHRVHIEFKPSMDDELELRPGQIVRMIHEYDDGWALCMRLDRSQQGVVPRQCLSTYPLKPRSGHRPNPAGSQSSMNSYVSNESVPSPLSPTKNRTRAGSNAVSPLQAETQSPFADNAQPVVEGRYNGGNGAQYAHASTPSDLGVLHRKPLPGQAM